VFGHAAISATCPIHLLLARPSGSTLRECVHLKMGGH